MVEAVPGQHQIADVGTKSLPAPRLEELKKMMKTGSYERTKEESEEKEEDISQDVQERDIKEGPKREDVEKILRVIVALGCAHHAYAQEEEEQREKRQRMGDSDFGRPSFCRSGADFPSSDKGCQAVLETDGREGSKKKKFRKESTLNMKEKKRRSRVEVD